LNIDIFNRLDNSIDNTRNFIQNFITELNNYLNRDKSEYLVNVASNPDKNGKIYLIYFDENHNSTSELKNINELPEGTQYGTRLWYRNGKYTIDDDLTSQRLSEIARAERKTKELVAQYKQENVDYYIKYKDDDGFDVLNTKTGLVFSLSKWQDLTEEQYEAFQKDMTLNYVNGEYVIKEDINGQ
jgi:hypothetical protein